MKIDPKERRRNAPKTLGLMITLVYHVSSDGRAILNFAMRIVWRKQPWAAVIHFAGTMRRAVTETSIILEGSANREQNFELSNRKGGSYTTQMDDGHSDKWHYLLWHVCLSESFRGGTGVSSGKLRLTARGWCRAVASRAAGSQTRTAAWP